MQRAEMLWKSGELFRFAKDWHRIAMEWRGADLRGEGIVENSSATELN